MLELKVLKLMAATHRGVVNLSLRSLVIRDKLATKAYNKKVQHASDLEVLAHNTILKAQEVKAAARTKRRESTLRINAATNVIQNVQDELDNFTNNA